MENKIFELVNNIKEQQAELKRQIINFGVDGLSVSAKEIFNKHPGLKKFVIVGWTPSWNDGEPCYHSTEISVGNLSFEQYNHNGKYYLDGDAYWEQFEDFFEVEYDTETLSLNYANHQCKTLDDVYTDVAPFISLTDIMFDTNYAVFFSLEDGGNIVVHKEDYDCGY